jgi:hypothetical protein
MSAKIPYKIQKSNFELVRDNIAYILLDESLAQSMFYGVEDEDDNIIPDYDLLWDIYLERFSAIDRSEFEEHGAIICIGLMESDFENQDRQSVKNNSKYYIDVFTNNLDEETDGSVLSANRLHKCCGIIRHILSSTYYKRLGFSDKFIYRTEVNRIIYPQLDDKSDSANSRFARIIFTVEMSETQEKEQPIEADSYNTIMKIDNTTKGYKLTISNE